MIIVRVVFNLTSTFHRKISADSFFFFGHSIKFLLIAIEGLPFLMVGGGVTHKFAIGPTKDHFFEIIIYMYMYKANDPSYTCPLYM